MHLCVYDSTWEHPKIQQPEGPLLGSQWEESVLGQSTTHIATSLSFGEAQAWSEGLGQQQDLRAHSVPLFPTSLLHLEQGVAEGKEGRRGKEGQELEWDRQRWHPEIWSCL